MASPRDRVLRKPPTEGQPLETPVAPMPHEADPMVQEMHHSMAELLSAFAHIFGEGTPTPPLPGSAVGSHLNGEGPAAPPGDPFASLLGGFLGLPFGGGSAATPGYPDVPGRRPRQLDAEPPRGLFGPLLAPLLGGPGFSLGGPDSGSGHSVMRSQQTATYIDETGERVTKVTVTEMINGHTTTTTTVHSSDGSARTHPTDETPRLGVHPEPTEEAWGVVRVPPTTPPSHPSRPSVGFFGTLGNLFR
mmetsp:Transcript_8453/g.21623  ORF Transcript_8453/g.21623 Transcript_8453/m.21623 type:complete len:247 (-) Transcript_8453:14-754(-)